MTRFKTLSSDCEFGELKNSLIKDIVVIGVTDNSFRERMLREHCQNITPVVKLEIERMQRLDIVEPISEPTR